MQGWNFLETIEVPATGTKMTSANELKAGQLYKFVASGTCNWRFPGSSGGYLGDAEYWLRHDAYGEGWTKMGIWSLAMWDTSQNRIYNHYSRSVCTQGANPVHIYDSISTSGDYLLPAGNDITSQFTITPTYSGDDFTGFMITPIDIYSGPIYITIHLDYGYKKTLGKLSKDNTNAIGSVNIYELTKYTFTVSGPFANSDKIENRNVFKRDPGFVGQVTDSEGAPFAGVKVQIYGPDAELLATVYTDKDGWYFYNYKYTGKAATFYDYKRKEIEILALNTSKKL